MVLLQVTDRIRRALEEYEAIEKSTQEIVNDETVSTIPATVNRRSVDDRSKLSSDSKVDEEPKISTDSTVEKTVSTDFKRVNSEFNDCTLEETSAVSGSYKGSVRSTTGLASPASDNEPSEARKRGSGRGSPRKLDNRLLSECFRPTPRVTDETVSVTHKRLIHISKVLCEHGHNEYVLSELVKGTGVYFAPKPAPVAKSKQFLEQMERLRREQQEKEYQEMVGSSSWSPTDTSTPSFAQESKELNEQISTIFNIIISVASVAAALWYWSPGYSLPARTLISVFGALVILVAEVVIYLRYKGRVDTARQIEQHKREKKSVVSHFEFGFRTNSPSVVEKPVEESAKPGMRHRKRNT
jgi:hypothetical protein